jgi:hypothetical protein
MPTADSRAERRFKTTYRILSLAIRATDHLLLAHGV